MKSATHLKLLIFLGNFLNEFGLKILSNQMLVDSLWFPDPQEYSLVLNRHSGFLPSPVFTVEKSEDNNPIHTTHS